MFVAGAGQVKFTKDYEAAGLKGKIPRYGAFITEGTLAAQGSSAQGLQAVLHQALPRPTAAIRRMQDATAAIASGPGQRSNHALDQPVHALDRRIVERALRQPQLAVVVRERRRKRLEAARDDRLSAFVDFCAHGRG